MCIHMTTFLFYFHAIIIFPKHTLLLHGFHLFASFLDDYTGWQKSDVQNKINWHLSCCHQHYCVYLSQLWLHYCTYICFGGYINCTTIAHAILNWKSIKSLSIQKGGSFPNDIQQEVHIHLYTFVYSICNIEQWYMLEIS